MTNDTPIFKLGEVLYQKTEDTPGVVTGIIYSSQGVSYRIAWQGRCTEDHQDIELTRDRPFFTANSESSETA